MLWIFSQIHWSKVHFKKSSLSEILLFRLLRNFIHILKNVSKLQLNTRLVCAAIKIFFPVSLPFNFGELNQYISIFMTWVTTNFNDLQKPSNCFDEVHVNYICYEDSIQFTMYLWSAFNFIDYNAIIRRDHE